MPGGPKKWWNRLEGGEGLLVGGDGGEGGGGVGEEGGRGGGGQGGGEAGEEGSFVGGEEGEALQVLLSLKAVVSPEHLQHSHLFEGISSRNACTL